MKSWKNWAAARRESFSKRATKSLAVWSPSRLFVQNLGLKGLSESHGFIEKPVPWPFATIQTLSWYMQLAIVLVSLISFENSSRAEVFKPNWTKNYSRLA